MQQVSTIYRLRQHRLKKKMCLDLQTLVRQAAKKFFPKYNGSKIILGTQVFGSRFGTEKNHFYLIIVQRCYGLTSLRLKLNEVGPHFFGCLSKVPDLGIGMQPKHLGRIHQWKIFDKVQVTLVITLGWYVVIHIIVLVEVIRLERVEQEVSHVLVHVDLGYSTIEVVDYASTVHHL